MSGLALTFDDGPDADWTPRVLDALAACGARATFFAIGPRAEAFPWLVARARAEGHRVELHCDEHVRHSTCDAEWVAADADRALGRLADAGADPHLWRAPWGDLASWSEGVAAERGLRLVGWTVDTHDWRGDDAQTMFAATAAGLRRDAVVLCHDGLGPGALRSDCAETVAYIQLVAAHARREGLALVSLADDGGLGADRSRLGDPARRARGSAAQDRERV